MTARTGAGDGELGDSLGVAGAAIISDARRAATEPTLPRAQAVHEVRKAFKRWRALLRLLEDPVGEPAGRMRTEARDLMRRLAGARDPQSALDAFAGLRKSGLPLSARSAEAVAARLTALRQAAETAGFSKAKRERLARHLANAALTLANWPVRAIGRDAVAEGLTATYRRSRRRLPDDWRHAEPKELHDLRRRVVEFRHQMDLIAPLRPRKAKAWAADMQRLRSRLGACQDLTVLGRLIAPHQPLAAWRSRLAPAIEARRAAHLKAAARLAGRLFAEKPKTFRKRVDALLAKRQTRKSSAAKRRVKPR